MVGEAAARSRGGEAKRGKTGVLQRGWVKATLGSGGGERDETRQGAGETRRDGSCVPSLWTRVFLPVETVQN